MDLFVLLHHTSKPIVIMGPVFLQQTAEIVELNRWSLQFSAFTKVIYKNNGGPF